MSGLSLDPSITSDPRWGSAPSDSLQIKAPTPSKTAEGKKTLRSVISPPTTPPTSPNVPTPPPQAHQPNPDENLKKLGEHYLKQREVEVFIKSKLIKAGYIFDATRDTAKFNNLTLEQKLTLYFWLREKLNPNKKASPSSAPTSGSTSVPTSGPSSRTTGGKGSQDFKKVIPVITNEIKDKKLTLEKLVARFFRAYLKNPQQVLNLLKNKNIPIRGKISANDPRGQTIVKSMLAKIARGTLAQKIEFLELMRKIEGKDPKVQGQHFTKIANFDGVYDNSKKYVELLSKVLGLAKGTLRYHVEYSTEGKEDKIYITYQKKVGEKTETVRMRVDDGIDEKELRALADNFGVKITEQGFAYLAHGASTEDQHFVGATYETKQDKAIGLGDLVKIAGIFGRLKRAYGEEKFKLIRAEYLQAIGFRLIPVGKVFERLDLAKGDGNRTGLINNIKEQYRDAAIEILDRIAPKGANLDMNQLKAFHTAMAFALISKDPGIYFKNKDIAKNWGKLASDFGPEDYFELVFKDEALKTKYLTIEERYARITKLSKKAKKLAEKANTAAEPEKKELLDKAKKAYEKAEKYQKEVDKQAEAEGSSITAKRKEKINKAKEKAKAALEEAKKALPEVK